GCPSNSFSDHIFDGEDVGKLFVKVVGPKRCAITRADQPSAYTHAVPDALNLAVEHSFNTLLAPGFERVSACILIFRHSLCPAHDDLPGLTKTGNQGVGKAQAEVFVTLLRAQHTKWQNRNRSHGCRCDNWSRYNGLPVRAPCEK